MATTSSRLQREDAAWCFHGDGEGGLIYCCSFFGAVAVEGGLTVRRGRIMPQWPLLRALRGGRGTRSLSLTGRHLHHLPWGLAKLKALESLNLRDNKLCRLPLDMEALSRVRLPRRALVVRGSLSAYVDLILPPLSPGSRLHSGLGPALSSLLSCFSNSRNVTRQLQFFWSSIWKTPLAS